MYWSKTRIDLVVTAIAVAMCLSGPTVAGPPDLPDDAISHQLIVRMSPDGDGDIDAIHAEHGTMTAGAIPEHNIFLLQLPPKISEHALLNILSAQQGIDWVTFNFSLGISDGSTQSFFLNASIDDFLTHAAFDLLELDAVHNYATGAGVVVAVLDTGIDLTHELLAGRVLEGGYNFIDLNEDVSESVEDDTSDGALFGHGTFVAGLIAHIAPGAWILPIKVLDEHGTGDTFYVAAGILHAIDAGADVLNLSLGTSVQTQILDYAVEQAHTAGALVVCAAGNLDQLEPLEFPAAHPLTIAVASTQLNDVKAGFTNYGEHIDLSAPGTQLVSSYPGSAYASASGTSASTAIVSGAAAVIHAQLAGPNVDIDDVRDSLVAAALNIDDINHDYAGLLGTGRLRLLEAVQVTGFPTRDAGAFDIADMLILLSHWGTCVDSTDCFGDMTGNGEVGLDDLLILMRSW
jgi:subtilisin family serine protease